MTRHSKVFVPVSAVEKYPDDASDDYFILDSVGDKAVVTGNELNYHRVAKVTHWLEEKENVYVLTEDELKDLLYQYEMKFKNNDLISPTTFLKSKIKI